MTLDDSEETFPLADRTLLVGRSPAFRDTLRHAALIARTDAAVLITGERGVGKEMVARLIHERSQRRHRKLVTFNVSALPDTLFESQMFGQKRGAFTGAHRDQDGYLVEADGGTLFLDEIGAVSLPVQAKLLRVIERKPFRVLGARADQSSDFRIVAATNENLADRIREGVFRADLHDRLKVMTLHVPPLRKRRSDIGDLVRHFFDLYSADRVVPEDLRLTVIAVFERYDWPGNIRELESAVQLLVMWMREASDKKSVEKSAMQIVERLREEATRSGDASIGLSQSRGDFERRRVLEALERFEWNIPAVAGHFKVDRRTVYRMLQRTGIDAGRTKRDIPPLEQPRDSL